MLEKGGSTANIGMSAIKERRLGLPVVCHPGDHVGGDVPFYFCPRSIMLFLINRANHPDLVYRGGQRAHSPSGGHRGGRFPNSRDQGRQTGGVFGVGIFPLASDPAHRGRQ